MVSSTKPGFQSRRLFLKRSAQVAVMGAASPWAMGLNSLCEAAALHADDYKAIVCVFLYGGNDYANTVVPYDDVNHSAYAAVREGMAFDRDRLTATLLKPKTPLPQGMQFALAPDLAPLMPLFNQGQMAVQLNVGPLVEPTTFDTYKSGKVALPNKLFSHNDQQSAWQSDQPQLARSGWGGRIGDLMMAHNHKAALTCISVHGNALFVSGERAVSYQISPEGAIPFHCLQRPLYGSDQASEAALRLLMQRRPHVLEQAYLDVVQRSIALEKDLSAALGELPALKTTFPDNNPLAEQLKMVAQLLAAHPRLGLKRQVFMVGLGGFDTHDNLAGRHPELMQTLAAGLAAFQTSVQELGLEKQVCTFTASDFGRTLSSNGDGTDHGWGGHHFVIGGAVQGGRFYGTPEPTALTGPQYTDRGRLIPTTSTDQFAASLARWMGVPTSELPTICPNIQRFDLTPGLLV